MPSNRFLFLGDNRFSSYDSRYWKEPYIESTCIKGKARFILYPFKRFGKFTIGQDVLKN
ncbi:S26 family signal peptidase [Clostridium sp. BJN0013]|uniref:S26 family signal peptidase n=1 Tax=Clostridium sp. BJN0013 TaxID=3236840 RepID=UPI0034C5BF80